MENKLTNQTSWYPFTLQIQLLHCIEQVVSVGGENDLSDGFKAAEELKREDPEAYKILTSTVLEYYDIGVDHFGNYHQYARHPIVRYVTS